MRSGIGRSWAFAPTGSGLRGPSRGWKRIATAAISGLLLAVCGASAQTIEWVAPSGGSWNTASNWDPQNVPNGSGETAWFPDGGGSFLVNLDLSPTLDAVRLENAAATLRLNGYDFTFLVSPGLSNSGVVEANTTGSILTGSIVNAAGATFRIPGGRVIDLAGPTVLNDGAFLVNADGSSANAYLNLTAPLVISGSGEVVMRATSAATDANLSADSGGSLTNAADHTIRGTGSITAAFTNRGRIVSDPGTYGLTLSGSAKTNEGTIEAGPGATTILDASIGQAEAARILANGGTVRLDAGAAVTGGRLESAAGGVLQSHAGAPFLGDLENLGVINLPSGYSLNLGGASVRNNGTIAVNSTQGSGNSVLRLGDGLVLDGTGEIAMLQAGSAEDATLYSAAGAWSHQTAGHTIHGGGIVTASIVNDGTIQADQPSRVLEIDPEGLVNYGLLAATSGGLLEIACDSLVQLSGGVIRADGGEVRLTSGASIDGGRFESAPGSAVRTHAGTVSVADVHHTGDWLLLPWTVTDLDGSFLTNDGTIEVNQGTSANTYLRAAGAVLLDGAGDVVMRAAGSLDDATLAGTTGAVLTQAAGHTIRGKGRISVELVNDGLVLGDQAGAGLVLSGSPKTNRSEVRTTTGGLLTLESVSITQSGDGRLHADGGSLVFHSSQIQGGRAQTGGDGVVRASGTSTITELHNLGRLAVLPGSVLQVHGPVLENDGTIVVNEAGSSSNAYLTVLDDLLLEGGGTVVLQTGGTAADANLATSGAATLTLGAGQTVHGEGQIGARLLNRGRITGDVAGRALALAGEDKENEAILGASGQGLLTFSGGSVVNRGLVEAADSSQVRVSGGLLRNESEVEAIDQAIFRVYAGVLENVATVIARAGGQVLQDGGTFTNTGTIRAESGGTVTIDYGTFQNAGTAEALSGGLFWCDRLAAHYSGNTLTGGCWYVHGGGSMRLIGANIQTLNAELILDGAGATVWRDEGGTDAIAGLTAVGPAGRLEVRNGRHLDRPMSLTSSGTVRVGESTTLSVAGIYRQTTAPGTRTTSVDGILSAVDSLVFEGGFVEGSGRLVGQVHNRGVLRPGTSVGTLTIEGEYRQEHPGALEIELGGTGAGEFDRLVILGPARFGGRLALSVADGYVPEDGDTFEVARFGSREGSFDEFWRCPAPGVCSELAWTDTTLVVTLRVLESSGIEEPAGDGPEADGDDGTDADDEADAEGADADDGTAGDDALGGPAGPAGPGDGSGGGVDTALPSTVSLSWRLGMDAGPVLTLELPKASEVLLTLFDPSGREVRAVVDRSMSAGTHSIRWDGHDGRGGRLPRGVYFARAVVRASGDAVHVVASKGLLLR